MHRQTDHIFICDGNVSFLYPADVWADQKRNSGTGSEDFNGCAWNVLHGQYRRNTLDVSYYVKETDG